jgi:hypothetical protein
MRPKNGGADLNLRREITLKRVAIQWVRFTLRLSVVGGSASDDKTSKIISLYPAGVTAETISRGRIGVDSNGELVREETIAHGPFEATPSYQPRVLGWRTAPAEAMWYWLPATHRAPLGSDLLFFSVKYPANVALWCDRSVKLAIRLAEGADVITLGYSAEAARVVGPS